MEGEGGPVVYVGGATCGGGVQKFAWYGVKVGSLEQTSKGRKKVEPRKKKRRMLTVNSSGIRSCRYRLVLSKKPKPKKVPRRDRVKLTPAAEIDFGLQGSCTMIGEEMYWLGSHKNPLNMALFRHDMNDPVPSSWEILPSDPKEFISPDFPFVLAPFGRKLFLLRCSGSGSGSVEEVEKKRWGGIYDLDSHKWEELICNIKPDSTAVRLSCGITYPSVLDSYRPPYVALDEIKQEILFYSLHEGSILFYDLTGGKWRHDKNHGSLALWEHRGTPLGLGDCSGFLTLIEATYGSPAMLSNNTLYWFTYDLHLYGYDINLRRWFRSPFLGNQFPTLSPPTDSGDAFPTGLVDLRNGKFLVIVTEDLGAVTVAPFTVSRNGDCLSIFVELSHPLRLDHASFFPDPKMCL